MPPEPRAATPKDPTLGTRSYVPFDVFAMQVDVPVSTMVRDGEFGWTCGQCPLDRTGEVLSPGDLVAQAGHVCDMIEHVLARGGFDNAMIGKLNVYFAEAESGEGDAALEVFARRFTHRPVIVPIPVPYFYYDGMMLEVDVFAGQNASAKSAETVDKVQIVDGGEMIWASVRADISDGASLADRLVEISSDLDREGLGAGTLSSDHWFVASGEAGDVDIQDTASAGGLITNPDAVVLLDPRPGTWVMGELTFCREPVRLEVEVDSAESVTVHMRTAPVRNGGAVVWLSGVCGDPRRDLIGQTRPIMQGIERSLGSADMTFADVTKLTAHYVGGASPEDLHGNMTIRHSFYQNPGPASTGLPVAGLCNADCRLSVDVVAVR